MVGCFGLMDDPGNAYHVSPERLTESHPCISVFALHRAGLLTFGISARLQTAHGGSQLATREAGKIWLDNQPVVIGSHPVLPQRVFICPLCQNIRYKLFQVGGRWACYRCHGLTHASHHRHRTIPNYPRLMRLRRKIGASLVPFSPITPRPRHHRRYLRIAREIRQIESGLVGHIRGDVSDVLERRDARQSRARRDHP
jgi:hypothetical protein